MGNIQTLAGRRLDDEFCFHTRASSGTGASDPRCRAFWIDALLHLQPDGRNRHVDAPRAAPLEESDQHCFDCQFVQLRTFGGREFHELGGLFRSFQMIRPGRLAAFVLPIILLSACGPDSRETPESRWKHFYDAGEAAQKSGDIEEAEKNYRDSIAALDGRLPSQNSAESALALSTVLLEKRDCIGALPCAQQALLFFQSKWNPAKPSSSLDDSGVKYLSSMLVVARALNCQHRFAESLPLLRRISALQEKVIVPVKFNHQLSDELRQSLQGIGKGKEAHKLRDAIKFSASSVASEKQIDVLSLGYEDALSEGKSALQGGNFSSAEKLLKHALELASKQDSGSIKSAEALLWLGDLQSSKGNYASARPMLEKALQIARRRLAKNDRDLKDYMKRLASVCANQSDWKRAAALDEEALALIFDDEYKHDKHTHRSRDLMEALIDIYKKDGQLDKAEKIAHRKIALEIDAYGKDSRKVGLSYCLLAEVLALKKNDKQAKRYFQQSLDVLRDSKKTDPRDMSKIFAAYANYLDKTGDKVGAGKLRDEEEALNAELTEGLERDAR